MAQTILACRCGACRIAAEGAPIQTVICHCESCRKAAERIAALPGAVDEREPDGGIGYVMLRKDRLRLVAGGEHLAAYRASPGSGTLRALATCCQSPVYTDFSQGHWLSVNARRWPEATRPAPQLRTMTKDRPAGAPPLPRDMPNPRGHTPGFMLRLAASWALMGFRAPKIDWTVKELADG